FVNFWVHNGFLSVDSTKMSKSLGNFVTAHEVLKEWPGEVVRLALLSSHYRDPLDWTEQRLEQAQTSLLRFYSALADDPFSHVPFELPIGAQPPADFIEALEDDLNVPLAITRLHAYATAIRHASSDEERDTARCALAAGGRLVGLLKKTWLDIQPLPDPKAVSKELIEADIAARNLARQERRFGDADRIRDELAAKGIVLEDGRDGTTWRRG
ncbi:MAG TPA: DALR domain-containing protein, partial [Stellaceae bacterium]|nr:DALR domain-containing protein [Stellaceae bacterium]